MTGRRLAFDWASVQLVSDDPGKRDHPVDQINAAYERILKSDVRYRFVIDVATL